MSRANVDTVERAIAALNARDINGYLACCTEDVELRTPWAEVGGTYDGPAGIERFLNDIEDTSPDFRLDVRRLQAVGEDRVLAFIHSASTGRASGLSLAADTTNVYELIDGKISRVQIFLDHREALDAVGLAE